MSTITTLNDGITGASFRSQVNTNFDNLNTDKAEKSGGTFTGDISVPDEVYGAGWDGSLEVPTKNAVYDKIQALPTLSDGDKGDITVSLSGTTWTIDNDSVSNSKLANMASGTIKGRTTVGSGDAEDLTGTQTTALLDIATTSLKGLMSSTDKTKLDGISSNWSYKSYSQVSNTGSTRETLYSCTLPGNTLGANGVIEGEIYFSHIVTAVSSRSVNIELVFGSTTASFQINYDAGFVYDLCGIVKFKITGTGSTSTQKLEIIDCIKDIAGYNNSIKSTGYGNATTTLDTTSDQTITIKTNPSGSLVTRTAESILIIKVI